MDKEEIVKRWEQVGPVSDGSVPSYQAKGPEGQFVQVHWIPQNHTDYHRLRSLVGAVQSNPPAGLVEVTGVEGGLVVVTNILPGQVTLDSWLTEYAAHLDPPPAPASQTDGPEDSAGSGDYSAYFRIPDEEPAQEPASAPEPPTPGPVQPDTQDGPPIGQSYTAFFEAPTRADRSSHPSPPPPSPKPESPAGGSQGFSPPWEGPARQPVQRQEPQAPANDPASITDMFRKPSSPPPRQPQARKPDRWTDPQKGLPPLELSLDEYLRRLKGPAR